MRAPKTRSLAFFFFYHVPFYFVVVVVSSFLSSFLSTIPFVPFFGRGLYLYIPTQLRRHQLPHITPLNFTSSLSTVWNHLSIQRSAPTELSIFPDDISTTSRQRPQC